MTHIQRFKLRSPFAAISDGGFRGDVVPETDSSATPEARASEGGPKAMKILADGLPVQLRVGRREFMSQRGDAVA